MDLLIEWTGLLWEFAVRWAGGGLVGDQRIINAFVALMLLAACWFGWSDLQVAADPQKVLDRLDD